MGKTVSLRVTASDAWFIQGCVKHDMPCKLPRRDEAPAGYTLREKVNDALLRFDDEDLEELELDVTEEELWLIDQKLPLGYEGARPFLLRVFKALWELDYMAVVGPADGGDGQLSAPL